ncbi:unnamed protein product [Sphagnum jensenii]|uniref:Sulfotransferase n=1 Tax=Sphagnum jensenii TaxID=128206 RepID=A0ABP1B501_9BRYO
MKDEHSMLDVDLCLWKDCKKFPTVWRLCMVVLIGAFSIYMCMIGVDHSKLSSERVQQNIQQQEWKQSCPGDFSTSLNLIQHYPHPLTYDRQECLCTPVQGFVILSMQRSGSGWFETLLNNHPNISSHGEIFKVKPRRQNFTTIAATLDAIYNLDWYSSAAKNECTSAVGFKWMLNQGAMEYNREVAAYFENKGVSVILLLRRNLLKRIISILANAYDRVAKPLNGTHKSHVHSHEEANKLAEYKPIINVKYLPENFERVMEITDDAHRFFNHTRLLVLYYEDLVTESHSLEQVQKFLGLEPRKLESLQVKIHTRPLSQQIQNWDEVLVRLKGTKFESFLDEEDHPIPP